MKLLAFDLETTGLDIKICEVIELGFALYDTDLSQAPILVRDFICETKEPITEEIEAITGISNALVNMAGVPLREALCDFIIICDKYKVEYLVAHNGLDYDIPVIKRAMEINGLKFDLPKCIDTKIDLPFLKKFKNNSLVFLNAEHGFLNPFPHRALFDAMSCMKLLLMYPLDEIVKSAESNITEIKAIVSFDTKDLAKAQGFNWDGDRKLWVKKLRESKLESERQRCQKFKIEKI